jgi:hypothetical protein
LCWKLADLPTHQRPFLSQCGGFQGPKFGFADLDLDRHRISEQNNRSKLISKRIDYLPKTIDDAK